jgi:tRNA pseudouridine38-40 synthase
MFLLPSYPSYIKSYSKALPTRYFIELAYKGTAYQGWQIQPNGRTVQSELNKALSILCKQPVETLGAGRTDTGVHARYFVAHFDTNKPIDDDLNISGRFIKSLNGILPLDMAVYAIHEVHPAANARFDALARTYEYRICTRKDPFTRGFSWCIFQTLDVEIMNAGAYQLMEYSDFTSFSKLHSGTKTNICTIHEAYWSVNEHYLVFTITADRFLRNMVRAITGTLVDLGKHKITLDALKHIIESKNRNMAGISAPAEGLYLTAIRYPEKIFSNK